jgi:hypothetical protein
MKRFSGLFAVIASVAIFAWGASAAMAGSTTLKTFGTGVVTITGSDSATIVNDAGEYGGVFIQSKSNSSKLLSQVVFQFTSRADVGGGAPRFSLPIDTNGTGKIVEGYAFIDAAGCGGISGGTTLVSTQNPACHVNFQSVDYANWGAFTAANPTYRSAQGATPFVIADVAGSYNVTDIVLR